MKMPNISKAVKTTQSVITANSPVLLVGAAISGVIATGVLAAKGGYKARGIVDEFTSETGAPPTPVEHIKLTWLCYAAPAVTGVTTCASVLGLHTIHTKRHAAISGLYAVATTKLDDYVEEAEKMLGPKKTQELNDAVAQSALDRDPTALNHELVVVSGGNELCYDEWGGRYFLGSVAVIEAAFAQINLQIVESGDANVNELYDHLGLAPTKAGANFGWQHEKVFPRFGNGSAPDGRAAVTFWFHQEPKDLSRRKDG